MIRSIDRLSAPPVDHGNGKESPPTLTPDRAPGGTDPIRCLAAHVWPYWVCDSCGGVMDTHHAPRMGQAWQACVSTTARPSAEHGPCNDGGNDWQWRCAACVEAENVSV